MTATSYSNALLNEQDSRCFLNPFLQEDISQLSTSSELEPSILDFITRALPHLERVMCEPSRHANVYSGFVGIAMTVGKVQRCLQNSENISLPFLPPVDSNKLSFHGIGLCCDRLCYDMYQSLLHDHIFHVDPMWYEHEDTVNEFLYGRAGLALLVHYFQGKGLKFSDRDVLQKVIASIPISEFPWKWHGKTYFGGAHGTAGILFALKRLGNKSCPDMVMEFITRSKLPSGNFKSSADSNSDRLVQWCHGAPGVVSLLLEFMESCSLQKELEDSLNVIWKRGLLQKGCSVCHGIAGNAYPFLAAFKATGNLEYLNRAIAFANVVMNVGYENCCAKADHPFSLFEGLSGTVMFLVDLLSLWRIRNDESALKNYQLFDELALF